MGFFKGQEIYSIDSKGRVNIPSKMRKNVTADANETFALTRGVDKCIEAYPLDEWKRYEEKFSQLNQYDPKNRFFLRTLLMWSEEVSLDSQQRITIPKKLLEFGEIESKVMIVGLGNHIEIWNPELFDLYLKKFDDNYESVASQVMSL